MTSLQELQIKKWIPRFPKGFLWMIDEISKRMGVKCLFSSMIPAQFSIWSYEWLWCILQIVCLHGWTLCSAMLLYPMMWQVKTIAYNEWLLRSYSLDSWRKYSQQNIFFCASDLFSWLSKTDMSSFRCLFFFFSRRKPEFNSTFGKYAQGTITETRDVYRGWAALTSALNQCSLCSKFHHRQICSGWVMSADTLCIWNFTFLVL